VNSSNHIFIFDIGSRHGIAQLKYETLEGRYLCKEITGAVRLSKRYIIELYIINNNIYLFIYLSIYLFVYSFIHLFIYSFIHLFIYSFIHLSIYYYSILISIKNTIISRNSKLLYTIILKYSIIYLFKSSR